ncbi:hypothetical protein EJ08DRAFT_581980 [Tothia fuscella]|uniref:Uncharacterized protein n=1 Tax=Tothia fuscella TaxID=1048955 RepID=A0A9P4NY41_9PEZI|nr:hypothetical protein EJ08DRAFT_581980 [Tothia fuscella]
MEKVLEEEEEVRAEEEEEGEPQVQLQFKQALNWKAGKPIAVSELLKRLEALARELQSYDQDEVERDSMLKIAEELGSQQLIGHKDRGVKAYTACCLVDILRLCAPNAPYTPMQLKEIFNLFIHTIFPALADPSSTYNGQHLYVLRSLAEVQSIILIQDVPGHPALIEALFKQCFDVLGGPTKSNSGEELSKNVEHHMTSLLSTVVEETQNLGNEVVETILAQFLRTSPKVASNGTGKGKKGAAAQVEESQATFSLSEAPPAYNMATNVCNSAFDKMGRYVSRYVSAILLDASVNESTTTTTGKKAGKRRISDDVDDDDDDTRGSMDLGPTKKAHELLRELWRATPQILQNVIPNQLETELTAENVQLRLLAVETVADMISGIGHAGPPPPTPLNPAAYPSQSLLEAADKIVPYNFLTTPLAPTSFISKYYQTYQEFLNRKHDKSSIIRAAWATAAGRVLMTSAGGVGLDAEEEDKLLRNFADSLIDLDEKVRFAAVKAVERFDFDDIIEKLGSKGGVSDEGSILANLALRVKDKKQHVRDDSIRLLAKLWGVAEGAIAEGSERVSKLLGPIPSVILESYFVNDPAINALVDRVLYESLLPLNYPPIKPKAQTNGNSQRVKDSQAASADGAELDPDRIRTERILLLIRDLEQKAKTVLFTIQINQTGMGKFMTTFLETCEKYNGGVMDSDENGIKQNLGKLITTWASRLPEPSKVSEDLWKFANMHDRRSYQLIRFCLAADSDYRKIQKSLRELTKRIQENAGATTTLLDTITLLVYRCSNLLYNRSHVPAIIEFSKSDENGLGSTAHEVLKEISKNKSEVFKTHVQELCRSLEADAPTAKKPNSPNAVDDLKACAEFARHFPKDVPKERKFLQAILNFVSYGEPPKAAKYGVFIILTTADRQGMYAKDIFKQCTQGFTYGSGNYLARLAALSQLMLLAPHHLEESETELVVDIAIRQVLLNPDATPTPGDNDPAWEDQMDDDCAAKVWALKILTNRLRGYGPDDETVEEAHKPVFQFLNTLVQKHGQISKTSGSPAAHQSWLRLVASQLLLKLCCEKRFNQRLLATAFNCLATVAMDSNEHVRSGFVNKLMKYLGQSKLSYRFYTPLFLLGHEVVPSIKNRATTWLKSRGAFFAKKKETPLEAVFARLLSLLAHHPDWTTEEDSNPDDKSTDFENDLKMLLEFILFYLKCVAIKDNISLIYHISQRVKQVQDGIIPADTPGPLSREVMNERLYALSDLSQHVIETYAEAQGWHIQAWPGKKMSMPAGIFVLLPDHDIAQAVAMKRYLPEREKFIEEVETMVKDSLKSRKRKHDTSDSRAKKRSKITSSAAADKKAKRTAKALKTPKKKSAGASQFSSDAVAPSSEPSRRSTRGANHKSYVESSDEEELANGVEDVQMEDAEEEEGESVAGAEPASEPAVIDEEEEAEEQEDKEVVEAAAVIQEGEEEDDEEVVEAPAPRKGGRKAATTLKKANGTHAKSTPAKSIPMKSSPTKPTPAKSTPAKPTLASTVGRSSRGKKTVYDMDMDSDEEQEEKEEVEPVALLSKAKAKTPKAKTAPPPKAAASKTKAKTKGIKGKAVARKTDEWDVPESDDDG